MSWIIIGNWVALQTAGASAIGVETRRRSEIILEDLKGAFRVAGRWKREYIKSKLNEHQRFLLDVIEKRKKIGSGELFDRHRQSVNDPLGEREYSNNIQYLVQTGLVKTNGEGRWKGYEALTIPGNFR